MKILKLMHKLTPTKFLSYIYAKDFIPDIRYTKYGGLELAVGFPALLCAIRHYNPEVISYLIERGLPRETLFLTAITNDSPSVIDYLLKEKIYDIFKYTLPCGGSALQKAVWCDSLKVASRLLRSGFNPHRGNDHGSKPINHWSGKLEIIAAEGDLSKLKTLASLGANLDERIENAYGATAMQVAMTWQKFDAVLLLLSLGANPSIPDNDGRRVLSVARTAELLQMFAERLNGYNQNKPDKERLILPGLDALLEKTKMTYNSKTSFSRR